MKLDPSYLKAYPGRNSPSPTDYTVERLFDFKRSSFNHSRKIQKKKNQGNRRNTPQPCTFGMPHSSYKKVIVGSKAFIDSSFQYEQMKTKQD